MPITMKQAVKAEDTKKKDYEIVAQAAYDKKAWDIVILNMEDASIMADTFVIASARNTRQAQSIADNIEEEMKNRDMKSFM